MYKLCTPGKKEYPVLLKIWEASVVASHDFLTSADIRFFKHTIRRNKIFEQVDLTAVKDQNNKILGFVGVTGDNLEMLFLHPDARNKGIGKALLKHAIDNLNIKKVDVNEQNKVALNFYKHFGFQVVSRSELDGTGKPYPILHMQLVR